MWSLIAAIRLIAGNRAAGYRRHIGTQIGLTVAMAVAAALAAGFALALVIYLIALHLGVAWALGIGLGTSVFALLLIWVFRSVERRTHREQQRLEAERERAILTQTLIATLGEMGVKSALVAGIAGLALGLLGTSGDKTKDDDPPPDA